MSETTTYQVVTPTENGGAGRVSLLGGPVDLRTEWIGYGSPLEAEARAFLERIARLLTEEDEKLERQGFEARCAAEALSLVGGDVADVAWVRWERGIREHVPLIELRALEAAYRAATEAEQ